MNTAVVPSLRTGRVCRDEGPWPGPPAVEAGCPR